MNKLEEMISKARDLNKRGLYRRAIKQWCNVMSYSNSQDIETIARLNIKKIKKKLPVYGDSCDKRIGGVIAY